MSQNRPRSLHTVVTYDTPNVIPPNVNPQLVNLPNNSTHSLFLGRPLAVLPLCFTKSVRLSVWNTGDLWPHLSTDRNNIGVAGILQNYIFRRSEWSRSVTPTRLLSPHPLNWRFQSIAATMWQCYYRGRAVMSSTHWYFQWIIQLGLELFFKHCPGGYKE